MICDDLFNFDDLIDTDTALESYYGDPDLIASVNMFMNMGCSKAKAKEYMKILNSFAIRSRITAGHYRGTNEEMYVDDISFISGARGWLKNYMDQLYRGGYLPPANEFRHELAADYNQYVANRNAALVTGAVVAGAVLADN